MRPGILIPFLGLLVTCAGSAALESDRTQPSILQADSVVVDLKNKVRVYRGAVEYRQGTIHIRCNELTTQFRRDGSLLKGECTGNPGTFRQKPESSEDDVFGEAMVITLDQGSNLVTLEKQARISRGTMMLSSERLTYDLETEMISATGGVQTSSQASDGSASAMDGTDTSTVPGKGQDQESDSRVKLVIQPSGG